MAAAIIVRATMGVTMAEEEAAGVGVAMGGSGKKEGSSMEYSHEKVG